MRILIKEEQTKFLGEIIEKIIMKRHKDVLCDAQFDPEPDDDGKFWVNLFFKEEWYESQVNGGLRVKLKSGDIRNDIYQFTGVDIRPGISLKNC
jgi:hypothetical protein